MSSPFSSALATLDDSLQNVHLQLDSLGAALELNDDRLTQSLRDARQQAAKLRDLVRAERPEARWDNRDALGHLICELEMEVAARARRNQQRRDKLLALVEELDAGTVKHRFGSRTSALNGLRLQALKELRAEAECAGDVKELSGPDAGAWLTWACGLQEPKDTAQLAELRRDFPKLERFAGEMEEGYWTPAARPQKAAPPAPPSRDSEPAPAIIPSIPNPHTISEPADDEALMNAIAAAPHVKLCENCGGTFPASFQVCPFDGSSLALITQPSPAPTRGEHSIPRMTTGAAVEAVARGAHASVAQPAAPEPPAAIVAGGSAEQPISDPAQEPAEMEFERLKSILQNNAGESGFQLLDGPIQPRKLARIVGLAAAAVLAVAGVGFLYHSKGSVSKLRSTVYAAGANVAGISRTAASDADIQRDIERKLALLKDSSIQANVENGVVTLVGRTPSEWESLHAENVASQTNGVKHVKNEVEVAGDSQSAGAGKKAKSKAKK